MMTLYTLSKVGELLWTKGRNPIILLDDELKVIIVPQSLKGYSYNDRHDLFVFALTAMGPTWVEVGNIVGKDMRSAVSK
jgi:hypothetical protein